MTVSCMSPSWLATTLHDHLQRCVHSVHKWMLWNKLKLNPCKNEFLCIGQEQHRKKYMSLLPPSLASCSGEHGTIKVGQEPWHHLWLKFYRTVLSFSHLQVIFLLYLGSASNLEDVSLDRVKSPATALFGKPVGLFLYHFLPQVPKKLYFWFCIPTPDLMHSGLCLLMTKDCIQIVDLCFSDWQAPLNSLVFRILALSNFDWLNWDLICIYVRCETITEERVHTV